MKTEHYSSFDELWSVIKKRTDSITPVIADPNNKDMTKYRLNDVITVPTTFYVQQTSGTGRIKWGSLRLDPGVVYETNDKQYIYIYMR